MAGNDLLFVDTQQRILPEAFYELVEFGIGNSMLVIHIYSWLPFQPNERISCLRFGSERCVKRA